MNEVRTRDEAIAEVDQALHTWSTTVTGLLAQALSVATAAQESAEHVVQQRANEIAALEALLSAARDDDRRHLQVKLVRAREAHEQARRASVRVSDVATSVSELSRTHTAGTTQQVATARAKLSAMSQALDGYRSGGTVLGGDGVARGGTAGSGAGSVIGMGMADVDVSAADLDDAPILDDAPLANRFGKGGLSRADYRWAVQAWSDTVGPGVASGKTREDFAERDARSNARPLRRTADVYDMFLGTDRIRADRRPDGSLNIINGRHRLLIARELGIKSLPGEVS